MNILQYGMNAYFTAELRKKGHGVFWVSCKESADMQILGITSVSEILAFCSRQDFWPDVFFYGDDSALPLIYGIEDLEIPSVFYSIDTYCHAWHDWFARGFDYVLYAQKKFAFPLPSEYFPLYASYFSEAESFEEWKSRRDIPVSFVGNFGQKNNAERYMFFSRIRKHIPIAVIPGDYRPVYGRSRIVLNQSAAGEINFRTFEAMALGCGCLSDADPCQVDGKYLFVPGVNSLPLYPRCDVKRAADLCREWLLAENEKKLYETAMCGREEVFLKHSAEARAVRLEEIFTKLRSRNAQKKRLHELNSVKQNMVKAYAYMAEHSNIEQAYKNEYQKIAGLLPLCGD